MLIYYSKRAIKIFHNWGTVELIKRLIIFFACELNLHYWLVVLFTHSNNVKNWLKYDAPAKPYQTIRIRANDITSIAISNKKDPVFPIHYSGLAQTKEGDWPCDTYLKYIGTHHIKISFEDRFLNNKPWKETPYYRYLTIEKGFDDNKAMYMLNNMDKLYQSISENGYQPGHSKSNYKGNFSYREKFEPLIVIDAVGNMHLWDGRHRFCIAQILDLEIPVHVVCRHKQWQGLRDEIHNNGLPEEHEELRDHPDLQDVIDD